MWRENLGGLDGSHPAASPASERSILDAERALGVQLPASLRQLLSEFNGLADQYLTQVVWPVDDLVVQNRAMRDTAGFRDLYMSFDGLLFFGEAGNGDLFGFRILDSVTQAEVFAWNHETDAREWVAASLETFLLGWFRGEITR